ncbi:Ras-related protein Rap1 [Gryllus bimaculatus]|nr:Ras-related protein Rap1 [Gryllus bimaculatus]
MDEEEMKLIMAAGCLYDHIRWGEAFVVVYSVVDRASFRDARDLLAKLSQLKLPSYFTALLLGNKRDLDHSRQICVDDGQELSLQFGCQFYEVLGNIFGKNAGGGAGKTGTDRKKRPSLSI